MKSTISYLGDAPLTGDALRLIPPKNQSLFYLQSLTLAAMTNSNMTSAILVLFAIELEASVPEIGIIAAAGAYASVVSRLVFGVFSDRFGRRPIILFGLVADLLSALLCAVANSPHLLIVASLLEGLKWSAYFSTGLALVADVANQSEREKAVANYTLVSAIGMLAGPGLTTLLLLFIKIREVFYLESAIALAVLLAAHFLVRDPPVRRTLQERTALNLWQVAKNKNVLDASVLTFFFFFVEPSVFTYGSVYGVKVLYLSGSEVTALGTLKALVMIGVRYFISNIEKNIGRRSLLLATFVLVLVFIPLIGFTSFYLQLAAIIVVFGVAHGAIFPVTAMMVSESTGPSDRGLANAFYLTLGDLSSAISPTLFGYIADAMGLRSVFLVMSVPAALGMAVAFRAGPSTSRPDRAPAQG
jgi:DHA1 family multidrug resistance protein-like MFS transporter